MEKKRSRESKEEIQVYRVSSKATKLFLKVIKATSINSLTGYCEQDRSSLHMDGGTGLMKILGSVGDE